MKNDETDRIASEYAKIVDAAEESHDHYVLKLYVTGMTTRSAQAIANIKAICERELQGRYELEIVDVYQHPELAKEAQIIAAPTLIKKLPVPLRRMIGDLSDTEKVLLSLNLRRTT